MVRQTRSTDADLSRFQHMTEIHECMQMIFAVGQKGEANRMARANIKLKRPITDFELDIDENSVNFLWIPCSERLPEEPYGCLVTVWDTNPVTMDEFENILPYFVGWDGEQWNDGEGVQCPFEVIAWMPLPAPYREEGEKE